MTRTAIAVVYFLLIIIGGQIDDEHSTTSMFGITLLTTPRTVTITTILTHTRPAPINCILNIYIIRTWLVSLITGNIPVKDKHMPMLDAGILVPSKVLSDNSIACLLWHAILPANTVTSPEHSHHKPQTACGP